MGRPWVAQGNLVLITAQPFHFAPPTADLQFAIGDKKCSLLLVPEWENDLPKQLLCSHKPAELATESRTQLSL